MAGSTSASVTNPAIRSAYWASSNANALPPSAIDTTWFTHIYYAFLQPSSQTFRLEVSEAVAQVMSNFTTTIRSKNPSVKTLLSIGGAELRDPLVFVTMASDVNNSRSKFIKSSIEVARKYGFDGMDLDWEFPENEIQMKNFGFLVREWREAIEAEAKATGRPRLLLTAAVYYSVSISWPEEIHSYPVTESMAEHMDWINVMAYDYHGPWEHPTKTGAHTALYDPQSDRNTDYGLKTWIKAGMPINKIVLGLAMYGRVWYLQNTNENGIGAPAVIDRRETLTMSFSQIEEFNRVGGSRVVRDMGSRSVYAFAGSKWVGYDDEGSVIEKLRYAQGQGLLGYFFWKIDDDSHDWKMSTAASNHAWVLQ